MDWQVTTPVHKSGELHRALHKKLRLHTSVIPAFYPGDEEAETGQSPQSSPKGQPSLKCSDKLLTATSCSVTSTAILAPASLPKETPSPQTIRQPNGRCKKSHSLNKSLSCRPNAQRGCLGMDLTPRHSGVPDPHLPSSATVIAAWVPGASQSVAMDTPPRMELAPGQMFLLPGSAPHRKDSPPPPEPALQGSRDHAGRGHASLFCS